MNHNSCYHHNQNPHHLFIQIIVPNLYKGIQSAIITKFVTEVTITVITIAVSVITTTIIVITVTITIITI